MTSIHDIALAGGKVFMGTGLVMLVTTIFLAAAATVLSSVAVVVWVVVETIEKL
jgi:hypothetical protein|tara:strand:+ start:436 stop:597 length:162 start_codon:yes stop_codon:yes gene_type:complete